MFTTLLTFGKGFLVSVGSVLLAISGLLGATPHNYGAPVILPAQLQAFSISGGGVAIGATTMSLSSFVDIDGNALTMANFGTKGYMTVEPDNKSREEQISFTGVTGNTVTGISHVAFTSPYAETSGFSKSHPGGAKVVVSNTSAFYSQIAFIGNTSTITGLWTYGSSSIPRMDTGTSTIFTNSAQLITKGYADALTIAGAPNGSLTVKGIYQEATKDQTAAGTSTGSTAADLIVPARYFNATSTATTTVPVTGTNGKLSDGFIDHTASYTQTASTTFASSVNMSSTVYAPYLVPTGSITAYATSTAPSGWLLADGSAYSTSTYSNLFNVIGYSYGSSTGNFLVPDLRGRFVMSASTTAPYSTLGNTGGSVTTTISVVGQTNSPAFSGGGGTGIVAFNGSPNTPFSSTGANNILNPYIILNYIIKY